MLEEYQIKILLEILYNREDEQIEYLGISDDDVVEIIEKLEIWLGY